MAHESCTYTHLQLDPAAENVFTVTEGEPASPLTTGKVKGYTVEVEEDPDEMKQRHYNNSSILSHSGNSTNNSGDPGNGPTTLYKMHWIVLLLLLLNIIVSSALFMSLVPIKKIAKTYYGLKSVHTAWLSNIHIPTYILVALPASYVTSKWGVRPVVITASTSDLIAGTLHFLGYIYTDIRLNIAGQVFAGIAFGMMLQMPGRMSALWFPKQEITTVTSICIVGNVFGVAVQFWHPTNMDFNSSFEEQIQLFLLLQLISCGMVFLVTIFFCPDKPMTSPVLQTTRVSGNNSTRLHLLFTNKHFVVVTQTYGFYYSLFISFAAIGPHIICDMKEQDPFIRRLSFWLEIAAIVSCFIISKWIEKHCTHPKAHLFLNTTALTIWLLLIDILTKAGCLSSFFIFLTMLGVIAVLNFSTGINLGTKMTPPVSEATSSAVILIIGNLYAFVIIFLTNAAAEMGHIKVALYCMVGLYFLSTVLARETDFATSNSSIKEYEL